MHANRIRLVLNRDVLADDQDGQTYFLDQSITTLVAGEIDEQDDPDWVVVYWGSRRFFIHNSDVEIVGYDRHLEMAS